jgi:hypothetical protein
MTTDNADRNAEANRIHSIFLKELDLKIGMLALPYQGMRKYERILYFLESARLEIAMMRYDLREETQS